MIVPERRPSEQAGDSLERDNERLATLLREVIGRLEKHVGVDLDKDGRVG